MCGSGKNRLPGSVLIFCMKRSKMVLAWAAVGAGACDDVVCCCGDKAGGKRNGGNGRGEAVGLAAACATEMNVQVFMGRKTCIVSCVCMRGTADFVFCGTAAVIDDVYQPFLNEK